MNYFDLPKIDNFTDNQQESTISYTLFLEIIIDGNKLFP